MASQRVGARPTEELAHSAVNHQTWEILSVKLGNSSIEQEGECRFKYGEFGILTPNIGKIVKPESKMRRMEIYSTNHNILNTIYAIMCMGRAGTIDFFHVERPMNIPVRTPQMGFQDRCTKGQRCPLLATSARNYNSCEQSLKPVG